MTDDNNNNNIELLEIKLLEKDKILDSLEVSEKRYRRLFESAKDGILILDVDTGKVIDVNPFMIRLLGFPYETFCGKYIWEIGAFKDIAASKEAFKILQDHEYVRYEDLPLQTREGNKIAVEFVSNIYVEDHSKVIQCNIRDITERRLAEVRIRKAFQMEAALRRIDSQILGGADTQEVLGTACDVIVEMGYRMCWIGRPDPDRVVRPVASAGAYAGYLGKYDIRWDDSPEGRGPAGTALRTGEHCVIRSIREGPLPGPWREKAIGNGYLSVAAIPMKSG
ncbi:MAG: PAS domain S-box protein, partial [Deltaproteobacteria bacterium]|nr:PAS domain S-box protein [Deltaproteobacteria bacterium]